MLKKLKLRKLYKQERMLCRIVAHDDSLANWDKLSAVRMKIARLLAE